MVTNVAAGTIDFLNATNLHTNTELVVLTSNTDPITARFSV